MDRVHHPAHVAMIAVLVDLWIALSVPADVRQAIGAGGVGPEVWRLAHVIVLVAAGGRVIFIEHRKRADGKFLLGFALQLRKCRGENLLASADSLEIALQHRGIEEKHARRLSWI